MRKLLVLVALIAACKRGAPQQGQQQGEGVPVTVAQVEKKTVPQQVTAIGTVEPMHTVQIRTLVGGTLVGVHFQEGQEVAKGDLLFTIDSRPYQAALAQAQSAVQRDKAKMLDAEANARRYEELAKKEYVTQQQAESARADAASLQATVKADEAAVEQAKLNLAYCAIRAPVTGKTGSVLVHAGNVVKANDAALVVIDQMQPIYVSFAVPERVLPQIRAREGEKLPVAARLSDQKPGEVPESGAIRGEAEQGVLTFVDNAVNSVTGTILLKATFENKDEALWPGSFAMATVTLGEIRDATVAPSQAVQRGQQGQYVFVVKQDGTVESRPVTVSMQDERQAVIEKGLAPGEVVVTDGQLRLAPGARVQVKGGAAAGSGT
ncbi:MAG TPA: efflux RND transporter periplasmic adaptor subunit [Myxococcales bacterium]